jgi:uncharacterized protein (DUF58 family)
MLTLFRNAEETAAGWPGLLAQAEKAAAGLQAGDHRQRKPGSGERFWQFREYSPSDRPQDIDWRQSAKGDGVFVRDKERQMPRSFSFWCDDNPGMDFTSDKTRMSKRTAAQTICMAIALLATRAHENIYLCGGGFRAGRTHSTLQTMARTLMDGHAPALAALPQEKIPSGGMMVLAGDFLHPIKEIDAVLSSLTPQSTHGIIIQTLDPAELTLPYQGRIKFEGFEHTDMTTLDHVESVRDEYQRRMQTHIEALRDLCHRKGWHYILHDSSHAPREAVRSVWRYLHHEDAGGRLHG